MTRSRLSVVFAIAAVAVSGAALACDRTMDDSSASAQTPATQMSVAQNSSAQAPAASIKKPVALKQTSTAPQTQRAQSKNKPLDCDNPPCT